MKNTLTFLILFLFIFLPAPGHTSSLDNLESYHEWLRHYGAIDVYAMSIREREAGPAGQIDYADALVSMGNPDAALSILKQVHVDGQDELQGKLEWIRHRALRKLGEFDLTILAVIEASGFLGLDDSAKLMRNEPGLDNLWANVWKRWYFHTLEPSSIPEGRNSIMEQAVLLARAAWPDHKLWQAVSIPIETRNITSAPPSSDQIYIARAMALWSIEHWTLSEAMLSSITDRDKRSFFQNYQNFLRSGSLERWDASLRSDKSREFTYVYLDHLMEFAKVNHALEIQNDNSWNQFVSRIKGLDPSEALNIVRQELSSALLPNLVRGRLQALQFVFELQKEPGSDNQNAWRNALSNAPDLPYTLYLAAALLWKDMSEMKNLPDARYPFLKEVLNSAGFNPDPANMADFWEHDINQVSKLYNHYPFDYALNYLFYKDAFINRQNMQAARTLAFLFPQSEIGQSSFLALAKHAYKESDKNLAWRYLQSISEEFAKGPRQMELLEAKAGILMDMGREDESLETYLTILEKDPDILSHQRRLRLALLAQESQKWVQAQNILEAIWDDRNNVSTEIQAEVLFWLGEGEQHQGNLEKALDYYLRLSWQFPEQNIWAVTAMYRAGLIYEQRGMLDTARNLFENVLKNAGRKSQQEAARQRLDAIDARMGSSKDSGSFLF
ncbi:tetratricopeptide repeat protein [Desulfonatronovibrio magnus]|uniref:tetratricopeptide repeat protein n=1 Tax=Desulfonatronovibrio magnus TaxID=698827 RepID=UPI0005EB047D|nr:tetratricopeptide repeat protein [Desulfonatronovibrio magnus]